MISLELQDALRERCVYLIVIALLVSPISMVVTIIRRRPRTHIIKDFKREQNEIYKTGIHTNPTVNEVIDRIEIESRLSGSGTATASTVIPILLKRRRDREKQGEGNHNND